MADSAKIELTPLSGALGAEIRGVDLRSPLSDGIVGALRQAIARHIVLVFPSQFLEPSALHRVAGLFGTPEQSPDYHPTADPAVSEVARLDSREGFIADVWHTDRAFEQEPPSFTLLSMLKKPDFGGDTMWSNQYLAYERLSEPMRELAEGLTAIQCSSVDPSKHSEHPLVRIHPETGRKALYFSQQMTMGFAELAAEEASILIPHLAAVSSHPNITCRHRWSEGDLAVWDDRCSQHFALRDYEGARVVHRLTVRDGMRPVGPERRWRRHADLEPHVMVSTTPDGRRRLGDLGS